MALLYDYHYSSNRLGEINVKGLCSQEVKINEKANLLNNNIFEDSP